MLHDVEVTTIETILEEFQSAGIDLLKLDIEGGEYDLVSGFPAWLQSTRVIFAELHERIVPGCEDLFKRVTANQARFSHQRRKGAFGSGRHGNNIASRLTSCYATHPGSYTTSIQPVRATMVSAKETAHGAVD